MRACDARWGGELELQQHCWKGGGNKDGGVTPLKVKHFYCCMRLRIAFPQLGVYIPPHKRSHSAVERDWCPAVRVQGVSMHSFVQSRNGRCSMYVCVCVRARMCTSVWRMYFNFIWYIFRMLIQKKIKKIEERNVPRMPCMVVARVCVSSSSKQKSNFVPKWSYRLESESTKLYRDDC